MPRHLSNTILAPEKFSSENVLNFHIPLRAQVGKPILVMVEAEKVRDSGLIIPDEVAAKYQPDYAVVYDSASCDLHRIGGAKMKGCRCPGCNGLKEGALVAVKPYTGNWYTRRDFDWIPEGRIVKIVGTIDHWTDNIPFFIEQ